MQQLHREQHLERLWRLLSRSSGVEAVEEYEVEAIVARRKRGRGWLLLVKWTGWPLDTTDGWEPRGSPAKCEALDKFECQRGRCSGGGAVGPPDTPPGEQHMYSPAARV